MRHCLKENSNSFLAMLLSSKRPILLGFLFKIGLNLGDGGGIVFLFFLFFPFFFFERRITNLDLVAAGGGKDMSKIHCMKGKDAKEQTTTE